LSQAQLPPVHTFAPQSASVPHAVKLKLQLPPRHLLAKQSTLPLHSPEVIEQWPVHTPPPAQSRERAHGSTTQPGKVCKHNAARPWHLAGISSDSLPQQSADVVQSICTHSLALGESPKLVGSQTPRTQDKPSAQSFFTEQPAPRPLRRLDVLTG